MIDGTMAANAVVATSGSGLFGLLATLVFLWKPTSAVAGQDLPAPALREARRWLATGGLRRRR
ncbi:hypothetical protein BS329_35850 [Amycolatopsis coloradensis]|uniref:Uncharacterized protein n=1 Tax=Amycolatopsis coloradensis TaxID=76021 RepID=A0A1R0KGG9_9PSEU|nr:hypothetical protein [Amycolatopsis coloradensis]OLZ44682.1 hypothetical protein BS329_35850 [Amycolatopsis coloradensis]